LSSKEAVASVQALSLVGQVRNMAGWATCIPYFDRLVNSTRDDRRAIGRDCTALIELLCALCFSALSSREAVASTQEQSDLG